MYESSVTCNEDAVDAKLQQRLLKVLEPTNYFLVNKASDLALPMDGSILLQHFNTHEMRDGTAESWSTFRNLGYATGNTALNLVHENIAARFTSHLEHVSYDSYYNGNAHYTASHTYFAPEGKDHFLVECTFANATVLCEWQPHPCSCCFKPFLRIVCNHHYRNFTFRIDKKCL